MGNGVVTRRTITEPLQIEEPTASSACCISIPRAFRFSFFSSSRRKQSKLGDNDTINTQLNTVCVESWRKILDLAIDVDGKKMFGMSRFCNAFFDELTLIDMDDMLLKKFQCRSPGRDKRKERVILSRIIEYALLVKDESFETKSGLRKIGRAHARMGIVEIELDIFNETFLRALTQVLDTQYLQNQEVLLAWTRLLDFMSLEMTIEKISFTDHISGNYNASPRHNSTSEKASSSVTQAVSKLTMSNIDVGVDDAADAKTPLL